MMRATELAHLLMRKTLQEGDWAIDATVGNGHDTLFLAQCVGPSGRVFGFDVQAAAIAQTGRRVDAHRQVTLFQAGHETLADHLPEGTELAGAMFNLGYLPGGPREIITRAETTCIALSQTLDRLRIGGLLTLVLYPGHAGGDGEAAAVRAAIDTLGEAYEVARFARINCERKTPELLAIERKA
jgi:predicted methyltransferase